MTTPATKERTVPGEYLGYWRTVTQGLEQAQQEISRAQALEQQAQQLRQSATARAGAYESFYGFLAEHLGLDPQNDRIEVDGTVIRGAAAVSSNGRAEMPAPAPS